MNRELTARIAIEQTALSFDKPYDYSVPPEMQISLKPGCRVAVPFGRSNRRRVGIVLEVFESNEKRELKPVLQQIDPEPILDDEMLKLADYLHNTVFCTYFDAVKAMLPAGITHKMSVVYSVAESAESADADTSQKQILQILAMAKKPLTASKIGEQAGLSDATPILDAMVKQGFLRREDVAVRRMNDATIKMVSLVDPAFDPSSIKLSPKQAEVANLLLQVGTASVKEICYFAGVTPVVVNGLVKKGIARLYDEETLHNEYIQGQGRQTEITLTDMQNREYLRLKEAAESPKGETALLFGITGSGKTQVFLKLVDDAINADKGVIVLVPEIALTPQTLSIFNSRYGDKVAVFHSAMSMGRRMDEWKRVKSGQARIAIGTRSAVFAPVQNLGLIVMDEEQEHTYKSEQNPRYHARDVARFRGAYHSALVLLASATPSMESYSLAQSGKYILSKLTQRYGKAVLPDVVTVDMRNELAAGNTGSISRYLREEISRTLESGNQAIILLNRRGHNTFVSCPSCGYVDNCDNCSISMTYHSANKRMVCHYCGETRPVPEKCPVCGNVHMKFMGAGTQRVEEELNLLFPDAGVLRMDSDSTMTRGAYEEGFSRFAKGKYKILLGTQMVAKGLDFSKVTLVGVLNAAGCSTGEDYRAFERSFSLLTQVVGRSGRGDTPGTAVIQTWEPELKLIELAKEQDYEAFYNTEILTRKLMAYPPYCNMVMVGVVGADRSRAQAKAQGIFAAVKQLAESEYSDVKMVILGPSAAAVPKVGGKYRFRMLIKCRSGPRFREMLRKAIDIDNKKDSASGVSVFVDVNPETII